MFVKLFEVVFLLLMWSRFFFFFSSFLSACFGFRVVLVVVVCTRRSNCVRAFWVFLGCGRLFRIVLRL